MRPKRDWLLSVSNTFLAEIEQNPNQSILDVFNHWLEFVNRWLDIWRDPK